MSLKSSKRILVVDDEPMVRSLVVAVLASRGYNVITAEGPTQACALLDKDPEVGLLLTDVLMPDGNGCDLARQWLHRRPDLKVMLMSGYDPEHSISDLGDEVFLRKPFHILDLVTSVAKAFSSSLPRPSVLPEVAGRLSLQTLS